MDASEYEMYDEWAINFIHDYNIAHGHHDIYEEGDGFIVVIDAPHSTTLEIIFEGVELNDLGDSKESFDILIKEKVRNRVLEFDVDDAFKLNWDSNGNYTATELLDALNADRNFFRDVVFKF